MKSIEIKKLYLVHSWVGLITGILLFVIAFTGAVSVFGRPEIKIWANPELRSEVSIEIQRIETLLADQAAKLPPAAKLLFQLAAAPPLVPEGPPIPRAAAASWLFIMLTSAAVPA